MKKLLIASVILFTLFIARPVIADENHNLSIEDVLQNIKEEQSVDKTSDIDCDKITEDQLEELGEAVMGVMHPNEDDHELMDEMMGGEGSESLRARHIMMGKNYLGCNSGSLIGTGMMGGGMMLGLDNTWGNSLMGINYGWFYLLGVGLFVTIVVLGIMGIILLVRSSRNTNRSSLEIIKKRYAKGEITKIEYQELKKSLI